MTIKLKDMHPDTAECAAIHISRLADCTGESETEIFEKLIAAGSITQQNVAEMAQYFDYESAES